MVRVEYQSTESTGFPYLYCHGCGTAHSDALLIEGKHSVKYQEVGRWMRLCADCVAEVIRVDKESRDERLGSRVRDIQPNSDSSSMDKDPLHE